MASACTIRINTYANLAELWLGAGAACGTELLPIFYSHEWLSSFQRKEMHRVYLYFSGSSYKGATRFRKAQGRNLGQQGRWYICGPDYSSYRLQRVILVSTTVYS